MLRTLAVAGLFVFGIAGVSTAQATWQTVSNAERSFFVEMPGTPKHSSSEAKTHSGDVYTMYAYVVESGNEAFVVQTTVFPANVDTSDPQRSLQAGLDNAMKGNDGKKWQTVKWTRVQGLLAVDATGARNKHAIRLLSLMDGKRMVVLSYAGPSGSANSANATRFMKSLRIAR